MNTQTFAESLPRIHSIVCQILASFPNGLHLDNLHWEYVQVAKRLCEPPEPMELRAFTFALGVCFKTYGDIEPIFTEPIMVIRLKP